MQLMRRIDSHTENKNVFSMSECFDWNVWGSKVSRKTVPCSRSLYGETAVAVIRPGSWNGQSTRVRGSTLSGYAVQVKPLFLTFPPSSPIPPSDRMPGATPDLGDLYCEPPYECELCMVLPLLATVCRLFISASDSDTSSSVYTAHCALPQNR